MNIFGVVLIDPFLPSERIGSFPVFNEYLVEQINAMNPTVLFVHIESGTEKRNQALIDKIKVPVKCYFDTLHEWMKSGLLQGNWLYVGTHFETCVHLNTLGILNMMEVKKFDVSGYGDKFDVFVRPDLLLHGNRHTLDMPEGRCCDHEILEDVYCKWEHVTDNYYKCIRQHSRPLKEGYQQRGNQHGDGPVYYNADIDRSND